VSRRARCARAIGWAALAALVACGGSAGPPRAPLDPESKSGKAAKLEDLRGSLVSVDVTGLSADRVGAARSVLHSAVGQAFDHGQVAADMRALWALGSMADIRAEARAVQGGVALRYAVREQPRIRALDVRGGRAIPAAQWLQQMPIKNGDFFDPVRLTAVRRTMLEQLRARGHHNVKVAWSSNEIKGAGVDVVFTLDEGPVVGTAKVEFRGNKVVPKKTLFKIWDEAGGSKVGSIYWRDGLERALLGMSEHYFNLGYINAAVGPVAETLSQDGASMSIEVPIYEGDQYKLGDLAFDGALVAPQREYASRFGLRRGQAFGRRKVSEGIERIRELHRSKGQPNVAVVPVTEVDTKKKRIKLTLQVILPGAPPAQGQPAPAQGQPAPAQGQPAPAQGQPAPAQGQPAPAQGQPAPAQGQPAQPAPAQPAPASPAPAPAPASRPPG
jgi:outer membrane protein insertion porin family